MIEFEAVSKAFRRRPVLDDVSLRIADDARVALVGSNGAGKTTLIRCLLGEYVCKGKVLVDGRDPRRDRRQVLKAVGFVPQLPPPLRMSVGELVRFSAKVSDGDPDRMVAVSETLGLDYGAIRRQPFVKLSGGQKQKLLIAVALGRDCRVLVMDEPAANLDPESRAAFFDLLAARKDSTAMVISSHRLDEVAALVNRVVELDRGRVVLDDHVADAVDLSSRLDCFVALSRLEDAFAAALADWGFRNVNGGLEWRGEVPGPDRLRFLGMLSRYAGVLKAVSMDDNGRNGGRP
ncbi:MAG: ABC transporter ATP-binding protein [Hyphomicrobiales bacterium]|nr:ABC transporter ATP-binding protein [Hyphomicrobiales bacterium]MCP5371187.1 ABC transporter ATP-binding protein [Hyphomicrobiales bacterium]